MNSMKRQNDRILKEELPRSVGAQYATGDQWRNNSRKNEGMEPKQKQYPVVDVTGALSTAEVGAEARSTPCPKGGGQEELPHVRGQRQQPRVPDCDGTGMAERSYPASEVRGRSREDPMPEGRRPRGVTPRPRSEAAAESTRLRWRRNCREELPCV